MPCNPVQYQRLNLIIEKLEILTRLAPVLESDDEMSYTLAVLHEITGDYVTQLRFCVNQLAEPGSPEEGAA
jgi:hypothetical protein